MFSVNHMFIQANLRESTSTIYDLSICLINSLPPRRCGCNFILYFSNLFDILNSFCEIPLWWLPENTFDNKSTLLQVMAWCCCQGQFSPNCHNVASVQGVLKNFCSPGTTLRSSGFPDYFFNFSFSEHCSWLLDPLGFTRPQWVKWYVWGKNKNKKINLNVAEICILSLSQSVEY